MMTHILVVQFLFHVFADQIFDVTLNRRLRLKPFDHVAVMDLVYVQRKLPLIRLVVSDVVGNLVTVCHGETSLISFAMYIVHNNIYYVNREISFCFGDCEKFYFWERTVFGKTRILMSQQRQIETGRAIGKTKNPNVQQPTKKPRKKTGAETIF